MSSRATLSARLLVFLILALLFPATGCLSPRTVPPAKESERFVTRESGFHILARGGIIRYTTTLDARPPPAIPLYLRVQYENPEDPEQPLVEDLTVEPGQDQIVLESPPLQGLEADKIYTIEIEIFDDAVRTEPIDQHEVLILSTIEMNPRRRQ